MAFPGTGRQAGNAYVLPYFQFMPVPKNRTASRIRQVQSLLAHKM
jgi:hypothetical protein